MQKKDINLIIDNANFNFRAVGIIKKNNKILFQKRKNDKYWALPGGKISILERAKDTVIRELKEEIGLTNIKIKIKRPLWLVEYFYQLDNKKQHQYIIGYLLDINDNSNIINKDIIEGIEEDKEIIYKWININKLKTSKIKPEYLKEKLLNLDKPFEFIEEKEF